MHAAPVRPSHGSGPDENSKLIDGNNSPSIGPSSSNTQGRRTARMRTMRSYRDRGRGPARSRTRAAGIPTLRAWQFLSIPEPGISGRRTATDHHYRSQGQPRMPADRRPARMSLLHAGGKPQRCRQPTAAQHETGHQGPRQTDNLKRQQGGGTVDRRPDPAGQPLPLRPWLGHASGSAHVAGPETERNETHHQLDDHQAGACFQNQETPHPSVHPWPDPQEHAGPSCIR